MRLLALTLPLLLQSSFTTASSYTLEEVESQISTYKHRLSSRKHGPPSSCQIACGFLSTVVPQQVSFPNSTVYEFEESRYWSQQQELVRPACRLSPTSARHVSLAVLTSRVTGCKFAVRGGGHSAFEGAANIADGITIDLMHLNQITVSADKSEVSLGSGNIWVDVYNYLQPMNLTVLGGRVKDIGGGLLLGGGIAFSSVQHGWSCDNVNTYEVVLADGSIREVSRSSPYSDLRWALCGGGNNFGIVTRFDVKAIQQGDIWAGSELFPYTPEAVAALNDAFYYFGVNTPQDPFGQLILAYNYVQAIDLIIIDVELQYLKPIPFPKLVQNFTSSPYGFNASYSITTIPEVTVRLAQTNPRGRRESYWTMTVCNDADIITAMVAIWEKEVEKIKDAAGLNIAITFQPLTTAMLQHSAQVGGNPLGIDGKENLNLINIAVSWTEACDDERILAAAKMTIDESTAVARERHLDHPFLYQNYAAKSQEVFKGYGEDNLRRLRSISQRYDPTGVFRELVPGYHKI